jgi:TPR repeat protein
MKMKLVSAGAVLLAAVLSLSALGPPSVCALDGESASAPSAGGEDDANSVPLPESLYQQAQTLAGGAAGGAGSLSSLERLLRAAHLGHPRAQHALAAAYSAGLYQGVRLPADPGRAVAVDYFAALAGLPEAHMSTGYRYLTGLGVPRSCERAVQHYEFTANHAAEQISSRGYALRVVQTQLTNHIPWLSEDDNEAELVQYYGRMAAEGDARSMHTLGQLHMQGSLRTDQDLEKAAKYFAMGAEGSHFHAASAGQLGFMYARGMGVSVDAGRAAALLQRASRQGDPTAILALGYCYQHGLGMERNISTALELYQTVFNKHEEAGFYAAELVLTEGDPSHVLGSAGGTGPEVPGRKREAELLSMAQQFYTSSANRGHVLSMHRIGHIGMLQKSAHACAIARNFKIVAEAGDWGHRSTVAHRKYNEGDMQGALQLFSELAFQGYESAQMNAAFILSKMYCPAKLDMCSENADALSGDTAECSPQFVETSRRLKALESTSIVDDAPAHGEPASVHYGSFYLPAQWRERDWGQAQQEAEARSYTAMHTAHDGGFATVPHEDAVECEKRALALYAHSAQQGSGTAYLKVGDFHYYGLGGLSRDKSEAARYYQIAADMKNTHALFNLGIMHQTGDGVLKDVHLSKRFYDAAAVYDSAANTPSTLAVALLQSQQFLYSLVGEGPARELLEDLSHFVVEMDSRLGLGLLIFAARSYLLRLWLTLNKSVLISSSTRFETDAYTSVASILDAVANRAGAGYVYALRQMTEVSGDVVTDRTEGIAAGIGEGTLAGLFNSDVISSLLFFFSVSLFLIILRFRSTRRQRRREVENNDPKKNKRGGERYANRNGPYFDTIL